MRDAITVAASSSNEPSAELLGLWLNAHRHTRLLASDDGVPQFFDPARISGAVKPTSFESAEAAWGGRWAARAWISRERISTEGAGNLSGSQLSLA